MTYSIRNSRDIEIDTILNASLKTSTYGIQIPGENYEGYGEAIGQTLMHLVENFACPNSGTDTPNPANANVVLTNPVIGQIWYDTSNSNLWVYNGTSWNTIVDSASDVVLGTGTSGNYVESINGTVGEIEISGSGSESASITVKLSEDVTIARIKGINAALPPNAVFSSISQNISRAESSRI